MNIQQIPSSNQLTRSERLEARISQNQKMLLQYAANLKGSSLSDFLIRSAEEAAHEVIRENQIIKFSTEDSRAFVEALLNPSKPNKKFKRAYLNYKRKVSSRP